MINKLSFSIKFKYVFRCILSFCIIFSVLAFSACGKNVINNSAISSNSSESMLIVEDFTSDEISSITDSNSSVSSMLSSSKISSSSAKPDSSSTPQKVVVEDQKFLSGIWISFYDYKIKGKNKAEFIARINEMFDNIKAMSINNVFCHVRAHADAYYPSELFPFSADLTGTQGVDPGYDPMAIMIEAAHARGLKFHAWINPYRISTVTSDVNTLAENNIARIWANDGDSSNDRYYVPWKANGKDGLYFNPASPQVQKLIIDGVKEIINNYNVDGIHLDDYFYPTNGSANHADFDSPEYLNYSSKTIYPMPLGDWRRANVNLLVQGIYRATSAKGITFGISPSMHISTDHSDTNYTQQYADIPLWMSTRGYIDYIAPQLYIGYDYPVDKFKFNYLLDLWTSIERDSSVKMYIGLAGYKIGDATADKKSMEWCTNTDIISRQTKDSYSKGTDGVILYSYASMVSKNELNTAQMSALKDTLISIN